MLPAAGLLPESETAIEQFLTNGRLHLRSLVVRVPELAPARRRRRESTRKRRRRRSRRLRLRFNAVLTHFDLFENVVTQRSENETGVWLSGLDVVSADALHLRGTTTMRRRLFVTWIAGAGGAIRRCPHAIAGRRR